MNNQSNYIFAYLLIAFVVFVTMRGELPRYMGFLLSNQPADTATPSSGGGSSSGGGAAPVASGSGSQALANDPLGTIGKLLPFAAMLF